MIRLLILILMFVFVGCGEKNKSPKVEDVTQSFLNTVGGQTFRAPNSKLYSEMKILRSGKVIQSDKDDVCPSKSSGSVMEVKTSGSVVEPLYNGEAVGSFERTYWIYIELDEIVFDEQAYNERYGVVGSGYVPFTKQQCREQIENLKLESYPKEDRIFAYSYDYFMIEVRPRTMSENDTDYFDQNFVGAGLTPENIASR
ncbi:MAG: hypothetical protein CL677_03265 [Bdellovibrionaceae bacterium]|nr:hypothetical protein [Pseudobdellovibrionaceae bacterium]